MPTKTLDERVARIEKIFWVVAVLALIFGISGAWGLNALKREKTEITSLQTAVDGVKANVDGVIVDVDRVKADAKDAVDRVKADVKDAVTEGIETIKNEKERQLIAIKRDPLLLDLSNRLIDVENRVAELKGIPANVKVQHGWRWDKESQAILYTEYEKKPVSAAKGGKPNFTASGNYVLLTTN